jgi:hypothetical protein
MLKLMPSYAEWVEVGHGMSIVLLGNLGDTNITFMPRDLGSRLNDEIEEGGCKLRQGV